MYNFDFLYFFSGILPRIGEFLGYLLAFGEVDVVVLDYLLMGNEFSWEVLNLFTGSKFIVNVPSYGAIFDTLVDFIPDNGFIAELFEKLINLFENFLSHFGHVVYKLIFGLPVGLPLWLGLVSAIPRFIILTSIFRFFKNIVIDTVT